MNETTYWVSSTLVTGSGVTKTSTCCSVRLVARRTECTSGIFAWTCIVRCHMNVPLNTMLCKTLSCCNLNLPPHYVNVIIHGYDFLVNSTVMTRQEPVHHLRMRATRNDKHALDRGGSPEHAQCCLTVQGGIDVG